MRGAYVLGKSILAGRGAETEVSFRASAQKRMCAEGREGGYRASAATGGRFLQGLVNHHDEISLYFK